MSNELTDVRCPCGDEYPADSYDAGFIAGSGMCQNCDAAMPPKDIPAPVEQAGGDERAAFFKHLIGRHPAHETEIVRVLEHNYAAWKAWQARAALAQTSSVQELDFSKPLETENGEPVKWICADVIEYKSARVCVAQDTGLVYSSPYIGLKIRNVMPEQAEAERPEVVGVRYEDGTILSAEDCGTALEVCAKVQTPLMTIAQHERIVGELRTEIAMLRSYESEWELLLNQHEQERDSALARVAELEMLLRELNTSGLMQFSTADEEKAVRAALSGAQAQHSVPELPEGWLIELGFDVLDKPFRFADRKSHLPTIKVIMQPCEVDDESSWNLRDFIAQRIRLMLAAAPGKEGV
ncbi:hypothetical protein ACM7V5_30510 [Pseudomonas aeruginosa]